MTAKTVGGGVPLRNYELMVILDPAVSDQDAAQSMEKVLSQVTAAGGTVENIDVWGKRTLAYEILKHSEGVYVVANFTTTPAVANEIDRQLNLNESVLRTKLLRRDGK